MGTRLVGEGFDRVYEAAQTWINSALLKDDSLFTPGRLIWSSEGLRALREQLLETSKWQGSFEDWLAQLEGSPQEIYQLAGEILYVMFLVPNTPKNPQYKRRQIKKVFEELSPALDIPSELGDALAGLMGGGRGFQSSRPYYLGFLIEFAEQWKQQSSDEQNRLLGDPWAFKGFTEAIEFQSGLLQNNPNAIHAQREALLHLVHPDTFEGMVSVGHKILITKTFKDLISQSTDDIDRQLAQIRNILEPHYGARNHFFYRGVIWRQWDPDSKAEGGYTGRTYPENGDEQPLDAWDAFVRQAKLYVDSGRLETEELNYKFEMGEDLVAARSAVLDGASDWRELLQHALRSRGGHPIPWRLLDDFKGWCADHPEQALGAHQALWGEGIAPIAERISAFTKVSPDSPLRGKGSAYGSSLSVISVLLMGLDVEQYPPFSVTVFDRAYNRTGYERPVGSADEVVMYEHALGFLDRFIEEASKRELQLRHRLDAQSVVWGVVAGGSEEEEIQLPPPPENYSIDNILGEGCFVERPKLESVLERLKFKKNLILQGPPGTGKTWLSKRLAFALVGSKDDRLVQQFQFHPNLSYEDFVRGWRPGGESGLYLVDGPFLRAIDTAKKDPDNKYVIVIEEINRGNPAQILGEMLTLLETDKRTQEHALALGYPRNAEERVFLPDNLYIIGTMNIADRSIALVDLALRRRFAFVNLEPTFGDSWRNWVREKSGVDNDFLREIERRMNSLNEVIKGDRALGPQFQVGHSVVTPPSNESVDNPVRWFNQVVETEIGPLLEEYWFDSLSKAETEKQRLRLTVDSTS